MKNRILYVFGGEKAQGAEIVIERLMFYNTDSVESHLFISPGKFAEKLIQDKKPYKITLIPYLKKLNRSSTNPLKYYFLALRNYFMVSFLVGRYIVAEKINVVHANTIVPASYLLPLIVWSKTLLKNTIWLWSDHDISYHSRLDFFLSAWCTKHYNCTVVVSEAAKLKHKGRVNVAVMYNGLDPDLFKADKSERTIFRDQYQLNDKDIVIGMPAVVHPRKGQLQLIEAFNKLILTYPCSRLVFAGGYESATIAYSKAFRDAIESNIKIRHIGYMASMSEFYNGCDIIVNNSDLLGSEPLGTTIYEAMACEKIVVASITGGTPEIISDNIDGYLFEAENSEALEQSLTYIIKCGDTLARVKRMAREKIMNKFTLVNMAIRYQSIIRNSTKMVNHN